MTDSNPASIDTLLHCRWLIPVQPSRTVLENHSIAINGNTFLLQHRNYASKRRKAPSSKFIKQNADIWKDVEKRKSRFVSAPLKDSEIITRGKPPDACGRTQEKLDELMKACNYAANAVAYSR